MIIFEKGLYKADKGEYNVFSNIEYYYIIRSYGRYP